MPNNFPLHTPQFETFRRELARKFYPLTDARKYPTIRTARFVEQFDLLYDVSELPSELWQNGPVSIRQQYINYRNAGVDFDTYWRTGGKDDLRDWTVYTINADKTELIIIDEAWGVVTRFAIL